MVALRQMIMVGLLNEVDLAGGSFNPLSLSYYFAGVTDTPVLKNPIELPQLSKKQ